LGGIYPSSKKAILDQLPTYCVPKDILLQAPLDAVEACRLMQKDDIQFPLVVKPNQGINGKKVAICHTKEDRDNKIVADCYFDQTQSGTRIVQEYADYQQEYGIMYVRLP
jgi:glutathione synthase/RimK-type ligase-like ATP-grasp enzyme